MSDKSWSLIFQKYGIKKHDFSTGPFPLSAAQIKVATKHLSTTGEKEVRILCKQDTRDSRPTCFQEMALFLLPVRNGHYVILQGDGYVDIEPIVKAAESYESKLGFPLESSKIGNSEMQHLDHAYATSVLRTFMDDPTLVLTIRGRKYTPRFEFVAGTHKHKVVVDGVQTEVDGGYEGEKQIVLVEAKNARAKDTIVRQLYYPMRQWSVCRKPVKIVFFEHEDGVMRLREYFFEDMNDYHSIKLGRRGSYRLA